MGLGTSILLIAIGAVLRFAVSVTTTGFSIHTVGVILMVAGFVGLLASMLFWSSWGGFGGRGGVPQGAPRRQRWRRRLSRGRPR